MRLDQILDTPNLKLFSSQAIQALENRLVATTNAKGNIVYRVRCLVRNKEFELKPEEVIRQLYLDRLVHEYQYSLEHIAVEYPIRFGSNDNKNNPKCAADIVVFDAEDPEKARIIIELKKPKTKEKDGIEQLKTYANSTGVPFAVWSDGVHEIVFHHQEGNHFQRIPHFPHHNQSLQEVLNTPFKYIDLLENDILSQKGIDLKSVILRIEDDVLAGAGVDAFEEVFKLIFIKLYDELSTYRKDRQLIEQYNALKKYDARACQALYAKMHNLEFRSYKGTGDQAFKGRLETLFDKAKKHWPGIFATDSTIGLTPSHLAVCVITLQECKFFNSNLEVIDDAFEYLVNKDSKGEKGQYFTPRYVIDMCVKMLNPKSSEYMIDPASGSCGFPIHTCFYVWRQIYKNNRIDTQEMLSADEKIADALEYVKNKVYAIDFDKKTVRIARTLNIIAGDGHTNVFRLNALNFRKWENEKNMDEESKKFNKNFEDLLAHRDNPNNKDYRSFNFDIVMANPPFAGNISESYIKDYQLSRTIIEFEGRKISQEGYQKLKPAQQAQATIQSAILESRPLLDQHGHLIVKHDLFNHEGLTQDGIAEAFIEFAKSEGLSFWRE
ncbi:type I restriction enzyme HsdR N-terminal domain-containing protein [Helicobacter salomonis]|uniref:type I restriction enzyme HsdR N-terminal domain-containing protein n=1 Tax=Helicobacter salomonis TaxID=56878 RepID=UPI000CF05978|nr:type I restriction enzyme HsdR N-terminal domain-containing protein [Helicobacter salomonis]